MQNNSIQSNCIYNIDQCGNNFMNNSVTKILGLNVCGLRSKLNNGIFDVYAKDFDILCLSETKLDKAVDIDFSGTHLEDFHCYTKD